MLKFEEVVGTDPFTFPYHPMSLPLEPGQHFGLGVSFAAEGGQQSYRSLGDMGKSTKTRSVGPPELPKGHTMGTIVPVRFKLDEFKAISKAAEARNQNVSQWIRSTLDAAIGT